MANVICPICHHANHCEAGENKQCWCTEEEFPKKIFDLVPEESLYKHCICKNCLTEFKEKEFLENS
ncbi:cysteine-rich CWC family protein [Aliibacillus thermotolerans]|uniref:Cysteine-rich CWC family protein n=1 Tax=Aliibacillus thermotolerans TaxID=1834418 RepID=A0ABW0U2X4_9BACI|nr:cysteine-rich CWC family protein [Aliibacillus thermotolerans]MDA3129211.1 hypothetical protein [Aliibacillus thermotolerans]